MPTSFTYIVKKKTARHALPYDSKDLQDTNVLLPFCILQKSSDIISNPIAAFVASIQAVLEDGGFPVIVAADTLQLHTLKINNDNFDEAKILDSIKKEFSSWLMKLKDELAKKGIGEENYKIIQWQDSLEQQECQDSIQYIRSLFGDDVLQSEIDLILSKSETNASDKFRKNVLISAWNFVRNHFHVNKTYRNLSISDWKHALDYVLEESGVLWYWMNQTKDSIPLYKFVVYPRNLNCAMDYLINLYNEEKEDDNKFKHARYEITEKQNEEAKPVLINRRNSPSFFDTKSGANEPSSENDHPTFLLHALQGLALAFQYTILKKMTPEERKALYKGFCQFREVIKLVEELEPGEKQESPSLQMFG